MNRRATNKKRFDSKEGKIVVFNMLTLDGYYTGEDGDISWHNADAEFGEFANEQTAEFGTQLYGRVTYELMESYWPTPEAIKSDPIVARLMNTTPKIVFSKTLAEVKETENWKNVTLYNKIEPSKIRELKKESTRPMAIFGSGTLVQEFMALGLIDEYRLMINPVILGKGKPLFQNIKATLKLKLLKTRVFKNGNILLYYVPEH
jgi:dihydrofolate reductase